VASATAVVGLLVLLLDPGIESAAVAAAVVAAAVVAVVGGTGRALAGGLVAVALVILGSAAVLVLDGTAWLGTGVVALAVAVGWTATLRPGSADEAPEAVPAAMMRE
jgi:hypothetical protein